VGEDPDTARRHVDSHLLLPLQVAWHAATKVRPGGTLLFMGGTCGRRTAAGHSLIAALTAALPALTKTLALEIAPVRVNLIAAGFVVRRCRSRCSATGSASAASSSGPRCRSAASSARPTSPPWPSIS
jgi:NAD(P)-dependent dehydrogenase (short-subunit alcohol dehydrogenase family)